MKVFDELQQRGLVKQATDAEEVRQLLDGEHSQRFFLGIDPTADSLHVGHLLQLVTAKRLAAAGHKPIILIGGATAMIGDPSGKTTARKMLSRTEVSENAKAISKQIKQVLDCEFMMVDNVDWFEDLSFFEFLRDIAPHFSVNTMLRAECFKSRLSGGLSFMEMTYMTMQGFDFFKLFDEEQCVLQIGGDDQWSNILAGIDLIHAKTGFQAWGLTLPLLTNSDGTKMGKTEKGAVWLDPNKTSPFEFFQFWRNIPDDQLEKCKLFFTDMKPGELIESSFDINWHKKNLAFEITKLVHGNSAAQQALEQAEALFEKRDASTMESKPLAEGTHILETIIKCGFAKSRTEARNLIINHGVTINDKVQTDPTINISKNSFGNELIVKKGKKHFCRLLIEDKCLDPNP